MAVADWMREAAAFVIGVLGAEGFVGAVEWRMELFMSASMVSVAGRIEWCGR
ncbi:hypothetical protein ACTMU2_18505 [Cupriavidus basilensis]